LRNPAPVGRRFFDVLYFLYAVSSSEPLMDDSNHQSVILHFLDGTVERGVLRSQLPDSRVVRYVPQPLSEGRRKVPRVPFYEEVKIEHSAVRRSMDLSTHGIYIESLTGYPVGTVLSISFKLGNETVNVDAKVSFNDIGIGMGLEFQNLSSSCRLKIDAIVQRSLKNQEKRLSQDRRLKNKRGIEPVNPEVLVKGDRRRKEGASSIAVVEVKLNQLKLLFFPESERKRASSENDLFTTRHEITIEFSDGEKVAGTLHEISPAAAGFFFDAHVSDQSSYTIYVNKQALKSIQYL
jgi:hypothetical protein